MFYINSETYFAAGGGGAARLPTGFAAAGGGINGRWIPQPACFFDDEAGGSSSWAALLARGGVFSSACTLLDDDRSEELDSWLAVGVAAGCFIASSFKVCWRVFLAAGASAEGGDSLSVPSSSSSPDPPAASSSASFISSGSSPSSGGSQSSTSRKLPSCRHSSKSVPGSIAYKENDFESIRLTEGSLFSMPSKA